MSDQLPKGAKRLRQTSTAVRAERMWTEAAPAEDHPYLQSKGVAPVPDMRVGCWEEPDQTSGVWNVVSRQALITPIRSPDKRIQSLQAVFPSPNGSGKFLTKYLSGADIKGAAFRIGTPRDGVFIICKDLAVGISLHICTGEAVIVAFCFKNLISVAEQVRLGHPNARILLALNSETPTLQSDVDIENYFAGVAADSVGGSVVIPQVRNESEGLSDFNELHVRVGHDAVSQIIARALAPSLERNEFICRHCQKRSHAGHAASEGSRVGLTADNERFVLLGYREKEHYIYSNAKMQVIPYNYDALGDEISLYELAGCEWWRRHWPAADGGIDMAGARRWLVDSSHQRGEYDDSVLHRCGPFQLPRTYFGRGQ